MGAFISAYKNKRDAIHDLELALLSKRTYTAADDLVINPTIRSLRTEGENLDAAIQADRTPRVDGPSAADAQALQNAILAAENAIRQAAAVNELANAAAILIGTMPSA